jgi:hypothetical protein
VSKHRERLPDRRGAERLEFEHAGRRWTVTAGRFDDGRVSELFIDSGKDSPLLAIAQEGAILASIALQYGAPLGVIAHALAGRSAGPLGAALALVDGASP